MGIRIDSRRAASGQANYFRCAKKGYDSWSHPSVLPSGYCQFYAQDIGGRGICKILLARNYQQLLDSGKLSSDDLNNNVDDPGQFYPMVAKFGNVMSEDLAPQAEGVKPEETHGCPIGASFDQVSIEIPSVKDKIATVMNESK